MDPERARAARTGRPGPVGPARRRRGHRRAGRREDRREPRRAGAARRARADGRRLPVDRLRALEVAARGGTRRGRGSGRGAARGARRRGAGRLRPGDGARAAARSSRSRRSTPPATLERDGVRVRAGQVRFTGPGTATVDGVPVAFRSALLATGSAPVVPPLPGLADVDPLTSDTVWDLDALPARLAVLGGGSIGCELGQAFARLGAAVTLVEAEDRLLGKEDPRAAALLRRALEADGVRVRTGSAARSVAPRRGAGQRHAPPGRRQRGRLRPAARQRRAVAPHRWPRAWRRPRSTWTSAATSSPTSTCAPATRGSGRPAT